MKTKINPDSRTRTGTELFNRARTLYFSAGDAEIAYRLIGAGPPLLLIHGWPLSGFTYRRLLPRLSEHYTCILPDLAGAGETRWDGQTDFTFPRQAARLRALMTELAESLGFKHYRALAHDTGGTIARLLALGDKRLEKLVLLNTEIPDHRYFWIPVYRLLFMLPGTGFFLARLLRWRTYVRSSMAFGGSFKDLNLLDGEFRERFIAPAFHDTRFVRGLMKYLIGFDYDLVDDFKQTHKDIRAKVLFVWGREDPTFPERTAREMVTQFREAPAFVSIDGARLQVHEEKPDQVCDAALPFLRD